VILLTILDDETLLQGMRAGAKGFLLKDRQAPVGRIGDLP